MKDLQTVHQKLAAYQTSLQYQTKSPKKGSSISPNELTISFPLDLKHLYLIWFFDIKQGDHIIIENRVEMSLSIFAVKNQWHKNGKAIITQVSGGFPKCSIGWLVSKPTTPSELPEGFSRINSTISGSTCFIVALSKALKLPACWESTPRSIPVTAMALTVPILGCSSI